MLFWDTCYLFQSYFEWRGVWVIAKRYLPETPGLTNLFWYDEAVRNGSQLLILSDEFDELVSTLLLSLYTKLYYFRARAALLNVLCFHLHLHILSVIIFHWSAILPFVYFGLKFVHNFEDFCEFWVLNLRVWPFVANVWFSSCFLLSLYQMWPSSISGNVAFA